MAQFLVIANVEGKISIVLLNNRRSMPQHKFLLLRVQLSKTELKEKMNSETAPAHHNNLVYNSQLHQKKKLICIQIFLHLLKERSS